MKKFVKPAGLILLLAAVLFLTSGCGNVETNYKNAVALMGQGRYAEAARQLDRLGYYEEAPKLAMYCRAIQAAEDGEYEEADKTFQLLAGYRDSSFLQIYYEGRKEQNSVYSGAWIYGSHWFEAIRKYNSILMFRDSRERAEACRKEAYEQAIKSGDEGSYTFASSIMEDLKDYRDAAQQTIYYSARQLEKQEPKKAIKKYEEITGFRDVDERLAKLRAAEETPLPAEEKN